MRAAVILWRRELIRFGRDRGRWIGALLTPAVFWLMLGTGMGRLEYFFPGTLVLIVLFSAIFSTFSVIEDRREGFLQGVLASPASREAVVAGKVLGGATTAMVPAGAFLALAPLAGAHLSPAGAAEAVGLLLLIAFGQTAFGFCFAWRIESTQGFHAIMNLLLMPMWFLSGALFPVEGAPAWLEWIMRANPLTYGVAAVRHAMGAEGSGVMPSPEWALAVTAAFAVGSFAVAVKLARRKA